MCVDILWLYIGSECAVLAVSQSLGRQKTYVMQLNKAESHYSHYSQTAVYGVSTFYDYPF